MKHNSSNFLTTLLAGVGLGLIGSIMLTDKQKTKARKQIKQKASQLREALGEMWDEEAVKEVFENASSQSQVLYYKAKDRLINNLSRLEDSWDTIDKEKYGVVVNALIDELKQDKRISPAHLTTLKNFFLKDFNKVKNHFGKKTETVVEVSEE